MPEIIFNGPSGHLEGRYQASDDKYAPIAIILHPHPLFGGTMNNKVTYDLFYLLNKKGFNTLRFNFRGVGKSQGEFDYGSGELSDAAAALDWLQSKHPNNNNSWVVGYSFGAWIAMQLLMRRPEIAGFISVGLQPNIYDFSFLAPCPVSGLIIHGSNDKTAPLDKVNLLVEKLRQQKNISIENSIVQNADHFFTDHTDELMSICSNYIDSRLEYMDHKPKLLLELAEN
ncbi:alpha/beta hydrolase [Bartonella sp. DGB1]|uniref:alpha/beta hydrolase n=1 Tax=Bartonella sp. DGB1 TaxID=3239807 RepID=UPI003525779B